MTAAGASCLGARVALVLREGLGGDCPWAGWVPGRALIAAAHAAHWFRDKGRLGMPVVLFEAEREILAADDPESPAIVRRMLEGGGTVHARSRIWRIEREGLALQIFGIRRRLSVADLGAPVFPYSANSDRILGPADLARPAVLGTVWGRRPKRIVWVGVVTRVWFRAAVLVLLVVGGVAVFQRSRLHYLLVE